MKKRTTGFTLIELLIVVAIIAILAAIAVPNFLEAQVRAKVSRSQSDMRSMATAIESYAVDNNRPPMGITEMNYVYLPTHARGPYGAKNNEPMGDEQMYRIWGQLTTPIAYMTSIPNEVFTEKGTLQGKNEYYRKAYTYQSTSSAIYNGKALPADNNLAIINGLGKSWFLAGHGPQRSLSGGPANAVAEIPDADAPGGLGYPSMYYDPTNGTVSFGYIVRSSAGIEPTKKN